MLFSSSTTRLAAFFDDSRDSEESAYEVFLIPRFVRFVMFYGREGILRFANDVVRACVSLDCKQPENTKNSTTLGPRPPNHLSLFCWDAWAAVSYFC